MSKERHTAVMRDISEEWLDVQENFSRSEIRDMLADTRAEIENAAKEREENGPFCNVELTDFHDARATLAKVTFMVYAFIYSIECC
jgi:hypothetical protein